MSSGSNNSQLLNMPDYGEGLSESLKAQISVLDGSLPGSEGNTLQNIMERYERPLRMSAAQIDNDVLRQTLLGGQAPVFKSANPENAIRRAEPGSTQATQIDYGGSVMNDGRVIVGDGEIPEWQKALSEIGSFSFESSDLSSDAYNEKLRTMLLDWKDKHGDSYESEDKALMPSDFVDRNKAEHFPTSNNPDASILVQSIHLEMLFNGKSDLINNIYDVNPPEPIYKKNEDGTDFIVPKDENGEFILETTNAEEIPQGGVAAPAGELTGYTRAGTGLVDMLGDSRQAIDPTTGLPTNRQAGFDENDNFLGLSALAEDIQRGNLSRQREADLADVERLSDRYSTLMDEYKPGTQQALGNASEVLDAQKDSLTGAGAIELPIDSIYGGDLDATTMQAAQVADPLKLSSRTAFGGEAGLAQVLNNDVDQGGRRVAHFEDSLRSQLLGDAKQALGQGLTDRETRAIQDSARARSTMMGRTFDPAGAIAESEARVLEDNNRRMQNRAFAQSVLGQEAGLQQGDLTRGMAQESEQAGMQQQNNLAQAQLDQQANAFDADSAMRAATINQGQKQQANQFEVGATMDAQRLNEQLKQSGTLGYIDAATRLAAMEDQYTLDPFQAILGRASGGSLQAGQGVFGQAGYGLQSGPQYLNPESGLGYISSMAANQANMYAANQAADASRTAGMFNMFGGILGGIGGGLAGR